MDEQILLADRFEADRGHLRAVAYRMLGSLAEAEDAVQEAWLRLSRAGGQGVDNLGGWLTTVVSRVCLDMLRGRKARREEPLDLPGPRPAANLPSGDDPEREAVLAETVGLALLVVLQTLAPAERIAFVLHDMFDLPFDEIGPIVGRSSEAARQLASRARRRVRGGPVATRADLARQRVVVDAFLAASRTGDLDGLLAVLDPNVVFRADPVAAAAGAQAEMRGASVVAGAFLGRAQGARPVLVDGAVGALVAPAGRLFLVLDFKLADGKVVAIDAIADPAHLRGLELAVLDA